MSANGPLVVFWDCDGVLANNSEALAMPIAGIILNEALHTVHPEAPQFDIAEFTVKYAGGHFKDFHRYAVEMLAEFDPALVLPGLEELDAVKVSRTVEVLTEQAMPAADMAQTIDMLRQAGLKQCVVSSSEFNRVLPCVEKIVGQDFGGAYKQDGTGGRVFSAADTMMEVHGAKIVKPDPTIAFFAAEKMGLSDLSRGVAIEDSESGVKCWVNAGIPVIGYVGGDHILDRDAHAQKLRDLGAVAVYPTMTDIGRHILKMGQMDARPRTGRGNGPASRPA